MRHLCGCSSNGALLLAFPNDFYRQVPHKTLAMLGISINLSGRSLPLKQRSLAGNAEACRDAAFLNLRKRLTAYLPFAILRCIALCTVWRQASANGTNRPLPAGDCSSRKQHQRCAAVRGQRSNAEREVFIQNGNDRVWRASSMNVRRVRFFHDAIFQRTLSRAIYLIWETLRLATASNCMACSSST